MKYYRHDALIAAINKANNDKGVLISELCAFISVISDSTSKKASGDIIKKLPSGCEKESTGGRGIYGATYTDYYAAIIAAGDKDFLYHVVKSQGDGDVLSNITIGFLCECLEIERTNNDLDDMLAIKITAKDKGIW